MNIERLQKMAGSVRTGGKGTVRRKKKAVHKVSTTDDKRLQATLKRLGVNTIPGIEEVNLFVENDVIHFTNPKVQASIAANTFVVSGPSQTRKLHDLLPSILPQLGADNMNTLRKLAEEGYGGAGGFGRGPPGGVGTIEEEDEEDDDDVPDLVENFDEAAK
ncbi:transcription factor [Coccomyxa subellipsoidea C-169]|uniref:Nascent polypeptide-associated complex subunit beta n=1 Tax=Coccomyxa subellipsoidea (strain C-169) TaxID=574566 RepID=I0Z1F6_COCSC|nr:transcription factor [Coccomyxa subellipsoidea C-169]EIE24475.1 transcription factor [Coccomyxa subellipsoidea C-169]|eukprot:XP_005649019.1 transcription factor [Coccomyxa subellipsoidea C-169]